MLELKRNVLSETTIADIFHAYSNLSNTVFINGLWTDRHWPSFVGHFLVSKFTNEEFDYVYGDHNRVDVRGLKVEKVQLNTEKKLYEHGAGILMRVSTLRSINGYDEGLRNCEDYDLLLRMQKHGSVGYYLPLPLYRYYIHGNNMTLNSEREMYWKVVDDKHGI